jgi:hypothetical protein
MCKLKKGIEKPKETKSEKKKPLMKLKNIRGYCYKKF